jgi:hypothetical protein
VSASEDGKPPPTRGDDRDNIVSFPASRRRPWPDRRQRPGHRIGSARGRWAYSTGDDQDGYPRGVYAHFDRITVGPHDPEWNYVEDADETGYYAYDVWVKLAPLPYVLRVIEQPAAPARFQRLYRLAMNPAGDPDPAAPCTRGQIRSGRWANRLHTALSGDPPIIRNTATAILELAESAPVEQRGLR